MTRRRSVALAIPLLCASFASETLASGFPPFVRNDSATVLQRGTVSVLDSGATSVLANDFDLEGDQLLAVLTRNVENGTLVFNSNGTFTYTHNGNDEDDDEFRYVAFDGTSFSRFEARVRIEIEEGEPVPPQITGQRSISVAEDESVQLRVTDLTIVDPDNNYPNDFTIEVSDGENYTLSGATVTPVLNFNGRLTVPVRVFDGLSFSNTFNAAVDVTPRNDRPVANGAPPDQEAIEGDAFSLALARYFDDVDTNDSLTFTASGLPPSGTLRIGRNNGRLTGTPIRADAVDQPYSVSITATDSGGLSASLTFALRIFPNNRSDLEVSSVQASNPTMVGESSHWDIAIRNLGPADLEEGELTASWATSGPTLTLSVPAECSVADNGTAEPSVSCPLTALPADEALTITIDGVQEGDGDNTLSIVVTAEDPIDDNNSASLGAQVLTAFSEGPTQIIEQAGNGLAQGDIDGDGLTDIVVAGAEASVYFNSGARTLNEVGAGLGAESAGTVVTVTDWNGDQAMDVVTAGSSATVHLNDGTGGFGERVGLALGSGVTVLGAAATDVDADGFGDVILVGSFGAVAALSRASVELVELTNVAGRALAVADFNSDGFADVAVVASADRSIQVFLNAQDGSFSAGPTLDVGSVAHIGAGDVDGDGRIDLLASLEADAENPPRNVIVYQQADGEFLPGSTFGASAVSSLVAGDVDADGRTDVVAINVAGVHQVYLGAAGGGLELDDEQIVSEGMRTALLTDFNTDQSLDLIMTGAEAGVIEVHANNGIGRLGRGDREAPQLTLLGEGSVAIPAGTVYTDAGVTATDDIDGNITERVIVTGNVNSSAPGTYTLNYSVADRAGNTAQASRTVVVGVNEGAGGGGGAPGPLWLVFLTLFVLIRASVAVYLRAG